MNELLAAIGGFLAGDATASGEKSQNIRLLDVFVVGPFMIWHGMKTKSFFMSFLGGATIAYNLENYMIKEGLWQNGTLAGYLETSTCSIPAP